MLAIVLGLLVGAVIGGLGGGGGVLTVPVLVYVLGQSAQDATTGSLVIVGSTALIAVLARVRSGDVAWRTGLALGAAGIPAATFGTLVNQRVAEPVLLLSFAVLTVLAAVALLLGGPDPDPEPEPATGGVTVATRPVTARAAKVVGYGIAVGFLTGFLGVGGGFLLVPVLVVGLRLAMVPAIATSLLVIAINSAAALATRAGVAQFDWAVLLPFTAAAVAGSLAGKRVADRLSGRTLQRSFAVLLLAVGAYVAVRSLLGP